MSLPQHSNPTARKDTALAPYNFVALPESVVSSVYQPQAHTYARENRFTGQIACKLTTESPLYTRAALESDEYRNPAQRSDKKRGIRDDKADFFYVDPVTKDPVIPGSSLRGMTRGLLEIIAYAKIDAVSDASLVYRSMDATGHGLHYRERLVEFNGTGQNAEGKPAKLYTPIMRAGYIHRAEDGNWKIQPARMIGGTTFGRISNRDLEALERRLKPLPGCRNAATVYFQPDTFDYKDVRGGFLRIKKARAIRVSATPATGLLQGALARSGPMPMKRSEAIVYPEDPAVQSISISEEMIESYETQISQEQEQLLGSRGVLNEGQPVFYLIEDGRLVFFGHTMMMRLPYHHTPKDYIPDFLRNPEQRDLAEAIFGFVGQQRNQDREQAWAGRVYFGDAHICAGQKDWRLQETPIIPQILGSPKPTTFQHYLVQRNSDPFRSGTTRDGQPQYRKELADYTANPGTESVIRGHKLYWHKGKVGIEEIQADPQQVKSPDEDSQHTRLSPVRAGVDFEFTIHFENLSDVELGALLWVLNLPGESGKTYRHKLGMGKPLGMGSVYLQPTLTLSNRTDRYQRLFDGTDWNRAEIEHAETSRYLDAFTGFILSGMNQQERRDASMLTELIRVQMLLRLLEWPGPPPSTTRYLEIERADPNSRRGKINEYRDRPVLPSPLLNTRTGNWDDDRSLANRATEEVRSAQRSEPEPTSTLVESDRLSLVAQIQSTIAKKPSTQDSLVASDEPEVVTALNKEQLQPGMRVTGKVIRVEPSRIVIEVEGEEATLQKENVWPSVRDTEEMEGRFPEGKWIDVYVLRINQRGRIQLTLRRK